jgi:hypothetical protein
MGKNPHVVIIGGGFGGLNTARGLAKAPVRVTLVDKRNYHLFRPLLYQVASGLLSADEIAPPLRSTDGLAWLRPFAVTCAFVDELPFGTTTTAIGFGALNGKAQSILVPTVETLHWGLSLQYSTYYLASRFTGGPPKDEPLNQLLPLVEFSFDTPRGQNTVATMNPGLAYVAVAWQLAAEVIVPLNREAGNSTGFRAQLLFFLDDLIPKLFDKPLLSDKPDRSLIAWH